MKKQTVRNWDIFLNEWSTKKNFKFNTPNKIFSFKFPDVQSIVDILRKDKDVCIYSGESGDILIKNKLIKNNSLEEFCENEFQLSHFQLNKYYKKGHFLYDFDKKIIEPWQTLPKNNNFTWERCYPIIFISGVNSNTNYHLDYSHVLAWQIFGQKIFYSLKQPDHWVSIEERMLSNQLKRPNMLNKNDVILNKLKPNELFWNSFLTPHWVKSGNQIAFSVNISHGGLKRYNTLCKHESELYKWRKYYNPKLGVVQH